MKSRGTVRLYPARHFGFFGAGLCSVGVGKTTEKPFSPSSLRMSASRRSSKREPWCRSSLNSMQTEQRTSLLRRRLSSGIRVRCRYRCQPCSHSLVPTRNWRIFRCGEVSFFLRSRTKVTTHRRRASRLTTIAVMDSPHAVSTKTYHKNLIL